MKNERVINAFEGFVVKFKELISEYEIDHNDYRELVNWLDRLGRAGEIPLFMDVFLETHALQEMYKNVKGTEPCLLGPYYIDDQKKIENPGVLPQRENEPGDVLYFSGTVRDTEGNPLANTKVDMWQADTNGEYSYFGEGIPEGNLRGVFYTDENGDFEIKTVVPGNYGVPTDGPSGEFLKWIDHHEFRPAHLHLLFQPSNGDRLITQVYFEGDEYLEDDVAQGVRGSLITKLEKHAGAEKGLDNDFYSSHLNFDLRLQDKPVFKKTIVNN
ncbi:dioxygenase [Mesobacillus maritimus]|uniref:dioxygenase family protein n=1 Tax=Mesobacillus maritimus TaxID=1643336 RepID=UPI00384A4DD9